MGSDSESQKPPKMVAFTEGSHHVILHNYSKSRIGESWIYSRDFLYSMLSCILCVFFMMPWLCEGILFHAWMWRIFGARSIHFGWMGAEDFSGEVLVSGVARNLGTWDVGFRSDGPTGTIHVQGISKKPRKNPTNMCTQLNTWTLYTVCVTKRFNTIYNVLLFTSVRYSNP